MKIIKKLPIQHYPHNKEREYRSLLLKYVNSIKAAIRKELIPKLTLINLPNFYRSDEEDDLDKVINRIKANQKDIEKFTLKSMSILGRTIYKDVSGRFNTELKKVFLSEGLGVNIFTDPTRGQVNKFVGSWINTNTRLIKSIPVNLLDDVAIIINAGFRGGSAIKSIKEELKKKFDLSDARARLIARDQIAKLNSNIIKYESLEADLPYYTWSTSMDGERVRESHRAMEGKVCTWLDDKVYKNNINDKSWKKRASISGVQKDVGVDYQCRCSPIPIYIKRDNR